MKKMEFKQMSTITGNGGIADGFCAGVGAIGFASIFLAVTPIGALVVAAASYSCIEYSFR
jgi:hypothetical protein